MASFPGVIDLVLCAEPSLIGLDAAVSRVRIGLSEAPRVRDWAASVAARTIVRRGRQGRTGALRPRLNPAPGSVGEDVQHLIVGAELLLDALGEFGPGLTKGSEHEVGRSSATQHLAVVIPVIKRV
jgi:hypothetical protein